MLLVLQWGITSSGHRHWPSFDISAGPDAVLAYLRHPADYSTINSVPQFLENAISLTGKERDEDFSAWLDKNPEQNTLVTPIWPAMICDHCSKSVAQDARMVLWHEENWPEMKRSLLPVDISMALGGHLYMNATEKQLFVNALFDPGFSYSTIMEGLFGISADDNDDWSEKDWLCSECVMLLMKENGNLRRWWTQYKQANGINILAEDCWWGYQCRTQRYQHHSSKLNHVCEPTRGDVACV